MVAGLAIQNSSDHVGGFAMNDVHNARAYFQPLPSADSYNKNRLEGDYKENEPSYGVIDVSPPPTRNMDFLGNIVSTLKKNETFNPNSYNKNRLSGDPKDQFREPAPNPGRAPVPSENVPFPHQKYLERITKAGQSVEYLAKLANIAGDGAAIRTYGQIYMELSNMINVINYRILNVEEQKRLSEIERLVYRALNNLPPDAPPPPAPGGLPFFGGPGAGGPGGPGGGDGGDDGIRVRGVGGDLEYISDGDGDGDGDGGGDPIPPLPPVGGDEDEGDEGDEGDYYGDAAAAVAAVSAVSSAVADDAGDGDESDEITTYSPTIAAPPEKTKPVPSNPSEVANSYKGNDNLNPKPSKYAGNNSLSEDVAKPLFEEPEERKEPYVEIEDETYRMIVDVVSKPVTEGKGLSAAQIEAFRRNYVLESMSNDNEIPKGKRKFLLYLQQKAIDNDQLAIEYLQDIFSDYENSGSGKKRITPHLENLRKLGESPGEIYRSVIPVNHIILRNEKAVPKGALIKPESKVFSGSNFGESGGLEYANPDDNNNLAKPPVSPYGKKPVLSRVSQYDIINEPEIEDFKSTPAKKETKKKFTPSNLPKPNKTSQILKSPYKAASEALNIQKKPESKKSQETSYFSAIGGIPNYNGF